MFHVVGGIVQEAEVDLFIDPEEAKRNARRIIEECRKDDRYANPEHPRYDDKYAEETREEYEKRIQDADKLRHVGLDDDVDLVILEVFVRVETNSH